MFSYTRQRKKLIKVGWVCITLEIICSFFINFQSSITIFYLNWFQFQIIIITIYEHPLVTWIYISKCKMYQNVTVEILSLLMKRKNKRTFNNISKKVIGAINKVFKKKWTDWQWFLYLNKNGQWILTSVLQSTVKLWMIKGVMNGCA